MEKFIRCLLLRSKIVEDNLCLCDDSLWVPSALAQLTLGNTIGLDHKLPSAFDDAD